MTSIFIFGVSVYLALLSWLGQREVKRVDKLEEMIQGHEKRIQKAEDIQGTKLDALSTEFKDFKNDINEKLEALKAMVHKEKNVEQQTNNVLKLLLEHLTKNHEN